MPDQIDTASDYEAKAQEAVITSAREASRRAQLPATGRCHHCGEDVSEKSRFCDAECRDAYEFEKRMKARQGRR